MRLPRIRTWPWTLAAEAVFLTLLLMAGAAVSYASHVGDGATRTPVLISNTTGGTVNNAQVSFNLSSQSLVDGSYFASDGLDSDVRSGASHLSYMPGTGRTQMLACFNNAAGNETVGCNSLNTDDITLPTTASDVYEFAFDNQAKHLWLHVSTAAAADWTITWEYWDGSAYQAFSNVNDGTNGFENAGLNRVSWDFPAIGQWPESTLHSVTGYWVRARVSSATSVTTPPTGQQAWYETGRWWFISDTLGTNEQKRVDTHLNVADSGTQTVAATIADGDDDGYVQAVDSSYPPQGPSTFQEGNLVGIAKALTSSYVINVGILRFDTSSIPINSELTAATLSCSFSSAQDDDTRNILWEWLNWPTGANYLYETTTQANAHSGTALSDFSSNQAGDSISFSLENLEHINKNGFTGLRGHISGGAPTGTNLLEVDSYEASGADPCSLSVTYRTPKKFHWYVPHNDGVTLSDSASLEPGDTFHLSLAGYFDMEPTSSARNIISKGTDFILRGDDGFANLEVVTNGSSSFTLAMSSGYHTVDLYQGGNTASDLLILVVDGQSSAIDTTAVINDNATDWTLARGEVLRAMERLEWEVSQSPQVQYRITDLPDHQLDDQTGNGFDAVARYPDTVSGFTATVLSTELVSPADVISDAGEPLPGIAPPVSEQENFTDPTTGAASSFSLNQVWLRFSGADNPGLGSENFLPYQFFLAVFAVAVCIFFAILASKGFDSVFVTYMVILMGLAIFWKWGNLPWWFLPAFGFTALPLLVWKRATP